MNFDSVSSPNPEEKYQALTRFGARPLKRAMQKYLLDPLAMKILNGEFKEGDRINVSVNQQKDQLKISI